MVVDIAYCGCCERCYLCQCKISWYLFGILVLRWTHHCTQVNWQVRSVCNQTTVRLKEKELIRWNETKRNKIKRNEHSLNNNYKKYTHPKQSTGEIQSLLDICTNRSSLKRLAHLFSNAHETMSEHTQLNAFKLRAVWADCVSAKETLVFLSPSRPPSSISSSFPPLLLFSFLPFLLSSGHPLTPLSSLHVFQLLS